jgi:hypothetical protein
VTGVHLAVPRHLERRDRIKFASHESLSPPAQGRQVPLCRLIRQFCLCRTLLTEGQRVNDFAHQSIGITYGRGKYLRSDEGYPPLAAVPAVMNEFHRSTVTAKGFRRLRSPAVSAGSVIRRTCPGSWTTKPRCIAPSMIPA